MTIELLYYSAGIMAVIFTLPSMYRLVVTKRSDELSITSWAGWLTYQTIALLYSIEIHATAYFFVNVLWIISYISMLVLIIKYRKNGKKKRKNRRATSWIHWPRG